jgi:3-deoxy-7-phosphoheptulonate synthase
VAFVLQVSDKMDPNELVKLIEILNPQNKAGRITIITRMGAENMRVKLPHLIRAVRRAGHIVTWVSDPMHGNTIKAPCGLKTRPFDSIRVFYSSFTSFMLPIVYFFFTGRGGNNC